HVARAFSGAELYHHRGLAARFRGRPITHESAKMHDRHQPAPERREAAHRDQGARHLEDLREVADFDHPGERQSVRLSIDAHQQISPHPVTRPRTTTSTSMRSAISDNGNTASTPPIWTAAVGIPAIT